MGYSREIYDAVGLILSDRRKKAENEVAERKAAFYRLYPKAEEIESILSTTAISAAKAIFSGGSAKERLEQLRRNNLALQKELSDLLNNAGYGEDYLMPRYSCGQCGDTGYIDGKMCDCMKKLLQAEAYRRLNTLTPLSLSTFESFSLDYYQDTRENNEYKSPRQIMGDTLQYCIRYAEKFSMDSPNLILTGGTGLGKTHMSLAIANLAIQKGYGVVYCSVNNIITKLEREHFGRDEGDTGRLLTECDLLILDDLGTEFKNAFSCAEIYNIVNTRLMAQKPTIISTNLSTSELLDYYTERFASRIIGSYRRIPFVGKDIRQQKRLNKGN
jgi:DNA replication protein DnaC